MYKSSLPSKSFFGAAVGTIVEYYDYALFTLFLPITAPLFFPSASIYDSLVKGFYFLFILMISRPLGALFFGYLGDYYGRRVALITSMYGIAIATICIGLTPSYQTIGIWAIVLITLAKSIQVFCFGGEYNGAGIYVVEHAKIKQESYVGSLLTATMLAGSLFASLIGILLTFPFMPHWSWRLAFFLGGAIGFFGIIFRNNLLESPHFKAANKEENAINLIKSYPREMIASLFIGGFSTVPFTTVLVFILPVLMAKGMFTSQQFMLIQSFLIFIAILTLILAGKMADFKTPAKVMRIGALSLALLAFPLLLLMDQGNWLLIITASAIFIIINELLLGPSNAYLKNLFPMTYRYRGSSLGFTLGMSFWGGLTPVVENYLYRITGYFSGISLWLIFLGFATWLSILVIKKQEVSEDFIPSFKLTDRQ